MRALAVAAVLTLTGTPVEHPPAADTYATGESEPGYEVVEARVAVEVLPGVIFEGTPDEVAEVKQYLAVMEFLRWHQVQRWTPLAMCESGGDWHINTGNGYSGGLQFHPRTWRAMGGLEFAPAAYLAEPWQQAEIADRLLALVGNYSPWPGCARALGLPR